MLGMRFFFAMILINFEVLSFGVLIKQLFHLPLLDIYAPRWLSTI